MNRYRYFSRSLMAIFLISLLQEFRAFSQQGPVQDNPVMAPNMIVPPVIDGRGDEPCWQNIPWQSIEQVWIPYGSTVSADDYSGRYKVAWSSTTNLLYFLVEIHDNVFVDGFAPGVTAEIYNYDIVEVFIDENKSGGLHVFDGTAAGGLGTNAENAFSYHIYADLPDKGSVTTRCYVGDLVGTRWANARSVNYASHFPEFAFRTNGTTAVREFSLIVYNDTYEEGNEKASRSQLRVDKIMGLSLAYCDNDNPDENPKTRDKFFGSVRVPAVAYNDHWMNADDYGTIRLAAEAPTGINSGHTAPDNPIRFFFGPMTSSSLVQIDDSFRTRY